MSRLLLARHGETLWHAENRYAGSSDVGLTPRGLQQAEQLGRWAGRHTIPAVYSSDLSRAMITAGPAAAALGCSVQVDARLREVDFGQGEGLTTTEMRERFPQSVNDFRERPGHSPFPGGESGRAALDRAWPALERIAVRHDDQPALVVMHSTLMRLILCRVLGMPLDLYRTAFPSVINAAVTTIELGSGPPALHGYNVPTTDPL